MAGYAATAAVAAFIVVVMVTKTEMSDTRLDVCAYTCEYDRRKWVGGEASQRDWGKGGQYGRGDEVQQVRCMPTLIPHVLLRVDGHGTHAGRQLACNVIGCVERQGGD